MMAILLVQIINNRTRTLAMLPVVTDCLQRLQKTLAFTQCMTHLGCKLDVVSTTFSYD
jgi:hypothetical protein